MTAKPATSQTMPLPRIEYRGDYLRASRTGGVALRAHVKAGRVGVTANTQHGVRASTRITKGTYVALQNGKFRFTGRYGKGPVKLNVSKTGLSASFKTGVGALNFIRPSRSSATIGGIQFRGRNALYLNLIALVLQLGFELVRLAILIAVSAVQLVAGLAAVSWYAANGLYQGYQERRQNIRLEEQIHALPTWIDTHFPQALPAVQDLNITRTKRAMIYLLTGYGRGLTVPSGRFSQPRPNDVRLLLDKLVVTREPREPYAESLALMWLLVERFLALKTADELANFYLKCDELSLDEGSRTPLQWALLQVIVERGGIVISAETN
jgi:hypothetical protein